MSRIRSAQDSAATFSNAQIAPSTTRVSAVKAYQSPQRASHIVSEPAAVVSLSSAAKSFAAEQVPSKGIQNIQKSAPSKGSVLNQIA
jgi:hypothetical protein